MIDEMTDNENYIEFIKEMINLYKDRFRSEDASVVSDIICDLGHYADQNKIDYMRQVKNGISHWIVEKNEGNNSSSFTNTELEIIVS
jgi:hypothetical protein